MSGPRFTEEQKTPWFSLAQPPSRPGNYELRKKGSNEIIDGRYSDGKWYVAFREIPYTPLHLPHSGLEWRGLISEPKIVPWTELTSE